MGFCLFFFFFAAGLLGRRVLGWFYSLLLEVFLMSPACCLQAPGAAAAQPWLGG
jgi:hypothetical protein